MTHITDTAYFPTVRFVVADPRTFDGDPYEVAERALKQAAGVASILEQMIDAADKMARNAEMERAFANHEDPKGSEWPRTVQARKLGAIKIAAADHKRTLLALAQAAGYNPRKPPKE